MDCVELCALLDERLDTLLSRERAGHSRRVAETAAALCSREGIDPEKGRAVGLAHDMCKELPKRAQRELGALYTEAEPDSALMADKIVHGPAAAALLARDYAVTDRTMLEAIAVHTVGRSGMGGLAIALYCADKLEPGRDRLDEAFRARCLAMPLESMLLCVVEGVIGWMRSQGREVAPETLILYSSLVGEADPL